MTFLSGNEAIVKGALAVGAKSFSGYPITPASSIMEQWASLASKKGLTFLQSEDEIAAIHHLIGFTLAGSPGLTATSGPGFSLMQEGLGLAYAYGAPVVVVNVMRSGPSTGKPTRAGQGEILASRFGTHGDIMPVVFYPNSVQTAYDLTILAFVVAWRHKVPVIILSDAYLAGLKEKISLVEPKIFLNKKWLKSHFTGLIDQVTNAKKITKIKKICQKKYRQFKLTGNKKSDTLLIGLGSVSRALTAFSKEYLVYAPLRVWPFLKQDLRVVANGKKRIIVVEMNQGQYIKPAELALGKKLTFVSWQEETIDLKQLKQMIDEA